MAELNGNNGSFQTGDDNNMEFQQSPAYVGSWQQILKNNVGEYCMIEFLIGTQNLELREGILYNVGVSFVVLYNDRNDVYMVCDLYSIKFVSFPASGVIPTSVARSSRRKV